MCSFLAKTEIIEAEEGEKGVRVGRGVENNTNGTQGFFFNSLFITVLGLGHLGGAVN